ncbi:MAG: epoxyqueuosine reductase QueH, partial [Lachnospiraceae bacterium]|nr:epoxyqueuosine reductase QueH [Lachnospiraceae bacterium]
MNKRNYQKELDKLIEGFQAEGRRPRLLIHSCCAPCSSYVMEYLSRYFSLTMFFYNPNMDSRAEYDKRAAELERLIGEMNRETADDAKIRLIVADYDPEHFEEIA